MMYHEVTTMITGVNSIRMDDSLISKSDGLLINFFFFSSLNTKVKNRKEVITILKSSWLSNEFSLSVP